MKVKSESDVAQLCPTLGDPMDCSLAGSSAHGIFQARVLEWGAIAFSNSTTEYTKYPIKEKFQLCLWRGMGFAVNVTCPYSTVSILSPFMIFLPLEFSHAF